jgi:GDPmannose 4,6-dehydratase
MAKTAFITGITGQDGAYLTKLLVDKGYTIHGGIRRSAGQSKFERLEALGVRENVVSHDFELAEYSNIQRTIEKVAPDEIYNLAAQSFVASSFEAPIYTSDANALGVARILESIRAVNAKTRFYQASTSEMFGRSPPPQNEETKFWPRSPYANAKLFGHWAAVNYRESFGIHATSGILFNHESPLRGTEFVTRKITLAFARIKAGKQDVLSLGNLDAIRDWGFAGDYVEGMWRMVQADKPDSYVLATGEGHTVRQFIEHAAHFAGWEMQWHGKSENEIGKDRKTGKTLVIINPDHFRPAEVHALIGSAEKAEKELGWRCKVKFAELVEIMMDADMKRVSLAH